MNFYKEKNIVNINLYILTIIIFLICITFSYIIKNFYFINKGIDELFTNKLIYINYILVIFIIDQFFSIKVCLN
jgi:hypothetical protein